MKMHACSVMQDHSEKNEARFIEPGFLHFRLNNELPGTICERKMKQNGSGYCPPTYSGRLSQSVIAIISSE